MWSPWRAGRAGRGIVRIREIGVVSFGSNIAKRQMRGNPNES
jgi:hypothetical protein